MKKHFLRILVVMLMACLGIGVMAACGDKKDEDPPVTYTVAFSLGSPSHAAEGVTAPPQQTGKKAGDTITLTTLDAAEDWKFDGWSAKSGKVSGTTYTVKAADAVEGTITLTAQWAEDGEPAPSSDIEGVWSGGTGDVADFTITIDVDGDTAHVVMLRNADDSNFVCMYLQLTKSGDGNFGLNGVTLTVDGDGHLVYGTGMPGQSMTFTTKAPLPAAPNITGTKYALHLNETYMTEVFEINFGSTPAIKRNVTSATEVSAVITVGGYKILTGTMSLLEEGGGSTSSITVIAFTEQSKNYAAVLMGTHNRDRFDLVDTAPTFSVTYDNGDAGEEEAENMPGAVTQKYKLGQTYTISNTEPTWEGHDFKGWKANIGIGEGTPGGGSSVSGNDQLYHGGDTFTFTTPTNVTFIAQWEANGTPAPTTCTVTFAQGDHGTLTNGDPVSGKEANQQVPLPTVDPAKGYKLEGWYKGGNKVANADATNYTVTADDVQAGTITLTAQYEPIEYTIEFAKGDGDVQGTVASVTDFTLESGELDLSDKTGYTRTGYILTGWTIGATSYMTSDHFTLSDENIPDDVQNTTITLTAKWTANNYMLSFTDNKPDVADEITGDARTEKTVTLDSPTVELPTIALKGYIFKGWKLNNEGEAMTSFTLTAGLIEGLQEGTTFSFTAEWEQEKPDEVAITFEDGEVEGAVNGKPSNTQAPVGPYAIPDDVPTCDGYTFAGWKVTADGDGKIYKHDGDNTSYNVKAETPVTFTATWTKNKYTVTYVYGEGTSQTKEAEEIEWGTEVTLTRPETKPGYEFEKWEVTGVEDYEDGDTFTMPKSAVTVTAKWTLTEYTVTFDVGTNGSTDGQTSYEKQTVKSEAITPPTVTAKPGYTFTGWKVKGKETTVEVSGTYTVNAEDAEEDAITLEAQYGAVKYTVEFVLGEHGQEPAPDQETEKTVGNSVTLTTPTAAADWEFAGWYTENEAKVSGEQYTVSAADDKNNDGKITLTAHWNSLVPTVTIEDGGAEKGDGDLTLTPLGSGGKYEITLPENTVYTAPAGKYFRGYTYGGKTYFPGEKITGIEPKAEVQITFVWEDFTAGEYVDEGANLIGIAWGAKAYTITEGCSLELIAGMKDTGAESWHGIINDGMIPVAADGKEYYAHFRVDGYVWTTGANEGNSNDTDALKVMDTAGTSWSAAWDAEGYNALYASTAIVYHIINVSLADDVLTYKYTVYEKYTTAEAADNKEFAHTTWKVNLKAGTTQLTMAFLIDCGHLFDEQSATNAMTTESAKVTWQVAISEKQNLSEENSLTVTGGWTREAWSTKICKGETMELKGKATLTASETISGWHGFVSGLYFDGVVPNVMRMDNWLGGMDKAAPQTANGVSYAYDTVGNVATTTLTKDQQYDASIKVDWSNATQIVVTMKIGTAVTTWTITAAESGSLAESYLFNVGIDTCTATFTSITRTHAE